jgi:hypothetical protein
MTLFFRILDAAADEKARALCAAVRGDKNGVHVFDVETASFKDVPGSPFAYWISSQIRQLYSSLPPFELQDERNVRLGASTKYDARFVRLWFEFESVDEKRWSTYANGSRFGRFFQDYYTIVRSEHCFRELGAYLVQKFPYLNGALLGYCILKTTIRCRQLVGLYAPMALALTHFQQIPSSAPGHMPFTVLVDFYPTWGRSLPHSRSILG